MEVWGEARRGESWWREEWRGEKVKEQAGEVGDQRGCARLSSSNDDNRSLEWPPRGISVVLCLADNVVQIVLRG